MAFRRKFKNLARLNPDIIVIQECETQDKWAKSQIDLSNCKIIWYGDNTNKGVAVVSFNGYDLEVVEWHNPEYRYILPIRVTGPNVSFLLFAVWAMNDQKQRERRYIGQVWSALQEYEERLNEHTIWVGDFNSNQIWDRDYPNGNHTDVVEYFKKRGLISVYHENENEEQGKESRPTLYLQRNRQKPYHIDYCFAPKEMISEHTNVEVGKFDEWINMSDHMPITIDKLNLPMHNTPHTRHGERSVHTANPEAVTVNQYI